MGPMSQDQAAALSESTLTRLPAQGWGSQHGWAGIRVLHPQTSPTHVPWCPGPVQDLDCDRLRLFLEICGPCSPNILLFIEYLSV